jgi:hypothetical protein
MKTYASFPIWWDYPFKSSIPYRLHSLNVTYLCLAGFSFESARLFWGVPSWVSRVSDVVNTVWFQLSDECAYIFKILILKMTKMKEKICFCNNLALLIYFIALSAGLSKLGRLSLYPYIIWKEKRIFKRWLSVWKFICFPKFLTVFCENENFVLCNDLLTFFSVEKSALYFMLIYDGFS